MRFVVSAVGKFSVGWPVVCTCLRLPKRSKVKSCVFNPGDHPEGGHDSSHRCDVALSNPSPKSNAPRAVRGNLNAGLLEPRDLVVEEEVVSAFIRADKPSQVPGSIVAVSTGCPGGQRARRLNRRRPRDGESVQGLRFDEPVPSAHSVPESGAVVRRGGDPILRSVRNRCQEAPGIGGAHRDVAVEWTGAVAGATAQTGARSSAATSAAVASRRRSITIPERSAMSSREWLPSDRLSIQRMASSRSRPASSPPIRR